MRKREKKDEDSGWKRKGKEGSIDNVLTELT